MPEREAAALLQAMEDYIEAYGADPAYEGIIQEIELIGQQVSDLFDGGGRGPDYDSPGAREARAAGRGAVPAP